MRQAAGTSAIVTTAAIAVVATLVSPLATASAQTPASPTKKPAPAARLADGHPDLQGEWSFATVTPLERPKQYAGKTHLTDAELADLKARVAKVLEGGGLVVSREMAGEELAVGGHRVDALLGGAAEVDVAGGVPNVLLEEPGAGGVAVVEEPDLVAHAEELACERLHVVVGPDTPAEHAVVSGQAAGVAVHGPEQDRPLQGPGLDGRGVQLGAPAQPLPRGVLRRGEDELHPGLEALVVEDGRSVLRQQAGE